MLAVIRYYRAQAEDEQGITGTWYAEYDGWFACRQFEVYPNRVLVAPYSVDFLEASSLQDAPLGKDVTPITLCEFESAWEAFAQAQLRKFIASNASASAHDEVTYFRSPLPPLPRSLEEASLIYTQFVSGVARRHFQVVNDYALVAPYDLVWPEHFELVVRAADTGLDEVGNEIGPELRPTRIDHPHFEAQWEPWALPRFRAICETRGRQ
jgi:hypothetical protein